MGNRFKIDEKEFIDGEKFVVLKLQKSCNYWEKIDVFKLKIIRILKIIFKWVWFGTY